MPLAKHLTRREGTYYFRVRVPKNLTTALGKKEIAYSLRTKDPHTAKELSYIHSYNISRSFRELELKLAENPSLMLSQSLSYENMGKGLTYISLTSQNASRQEKHLAQSP